MSEKLFYFYSIVLLYGTTTSFQKLPRKHFLFSFKLKANSLTGILTLKVTPKPNLTIYCSLLLLRWVLIDMKLLIVRRLSKVDHRNKYNLNKIFINIITHNKIIQLNLIFLYLWKGRKKIYEGKAVPMTFPLSV